jgi:hypothetical protein
VTSVLIRTTARLPGSSRAAFGILSDFSRYAEWNPLNVWADGKAALGAHVRMRALNPLEQARPQAMTVTVTRFEPPHALEWIGEVPFLFRGRHFFALSDDAEDAHLEHGEELSGLLPTLWGAGRITALWPPHYEALNTALAARMRLSSQ